MDSKMSCEFDKDKRGKEEYCIDLEDMPLAMSYVPWQEWRNVMEADMGLEEGTIFSELVLPFHGRRAVREGNFESQTSRGYGMPFENPSHMKDMGRAGFSRNMGYSNMPGECERANMRGRRCNRI